MRLSGNEIRARAMSDFPQLRLDGLHERHPGITQPLADSYAEAASVCWSRHHEPPVTVALKHDNTDERRIVTFPFPMRERRLVLAGNRARRNRQPVPRVDRSHRRRQIRQFLIPELLARLFIDLIGYVASVTRVNASVQASAALSRSV
jgi:hypothetical protein